MADVRAVMTNKGLSVIAVGESKSVNKVEEVCEDTLKNSRDYKLSDLQRGVRDLKGRLDAIEGEKSTFVGLTYKSFEAIDKRLRVVD